MPNQGSTATDLSTVELDIGDVESVVLSGMNLDSSAKHHTILTTTSASFVGMYSIAGTGFVFSSWAASAMSTTGAEVRLYDNAVSDANEIGRGFLNAADSKMVTAAPCFFNDGLIVRGHSDGINTAQLDITVVAKQPTAQFTITNGEYGRLVESSPTTNSSSATTTEVSYQIGDHGHVVHRWDLTSIPVGTQINSATMRLNPALTTNPPGALTVTAVLLPWVYDEVTWNEYSSGNSWNTAGATGSADSRATPFFDSTITPMQDVALDIDITALAQEWINGTLNNNGVLMFFDTLNGSNTLQIDSATDATNPPELIVIPA